MFINIFNYILLSFANVSVTLLNTISVSYNKNTTISICSVADLFPLVYSPYATSGIIQGIHKRMVRFQKLTRNLFLTLDGHNVHRQQRQLSKFLMRYQQFASHA